jgi:hypothetical protein
MGVSAERPLFGPGRSGHQGRKVRMRYGFHRRHADFSRTARTQIRQVSRRSCTDPFQGGSIMSKDSTTKANVKKKGKTTKEKQTAKRLKRDEQSGHSSKIPSTGH